MTTASSNKPQSAMAALLAKHQNKFVSLKKGESVKGIITRLTRGEITVDVGSKTEAIVLEKERHILDTIFSLFKVGDTVDVNVLNPESDNGNAVVSLRRYLADLSWKKLEELLKSKAPITVTVQDATKAGYVAVTDFGVAGFLPQSHTSQADLTTGSPVEVTVLELNRKDNKIIFSQKPAVSDEDFAKTVKKLKVGDKVKATITNISSFGIFTTFSVDGVVLEGFVHISEIAWEKVTDLASLYNAGEEIEAVVSRFDEENKRINLSVKRLTADPFDELMKAYPVDRKVGAEVTKVEEAGVTVLLESTQEMNEVEAFIKKEKIPPTTTYTVGQAITVTVSEFDKKKHRIIVVPVLLEKPLMYR
ncbi:MAG TPA: S1 RNA-binding domain-containing protein [Patescibacteria group bacterium]|nr:S1 RNA-binding domain-containing protein [Patescibacteria group bacterium]